MKKGEVDSKMMAALLTGVNRAYPFAKCESGPCDLGPFGSTLAAAVLMLY